MTAYRVTQAAKQDFKAILRETGLTFGPRQRDIYRDLIARAVEMLAADPLRGGSWDRGFFVPGLRAFHLDYAAGRRGASAHALYYALDPSPHGPPCVIILRLLHESMEPRLHLARSDEESL